MPPKKRNAAAAAAGALDARANGRLAMQDVADGDLCLVADLTPHPDNPRRGDTEAIKASIRAHGLYRRIVVQRATPDGERRMRIIAGNHTFAAARDMGFTRVPVEFVDCSDDAARRILLIDNRTNDQAGYAQDALVALLDELQHSTPEGLLGTGYDDDALAALRDALAEARGLDEAESELDGASDAAPSARKLPVDAIFCFSNYGAEAQLARRSGWLNGIISSSAAALVPPASLNDTHIEFIDNDWKDYEHARHLEVVAQHQPRYCTTRDIMTKAQCEAVGTPYLPLDTILRMAYELRVHAENVIVIPKYDCIADIPPDLMLGYSVKSSYGMTPLPAARFAGRRVHLLGGSWANQRRYLAILGTDAISFDNNYVALQASHGVITLGDGTSLPLTDLMPDRILVNPMLVSLAISFGLIGAALHELRGAPIALPPGSLRAAVPDAEDR